MTNDREKSICEKWIGKTLECPEDIDQMLWPLFEDNDDVERIYIVYLDVGNKVVSIEKPFTGTINRCSLHPREIIKALLQNKAQYIIMAHNHPGDTEPSAADIAITRKTAAAMQTIDAEVLDHLIFGTDRENDKVVYSMNHEGWLKRVNEDMYQFLNGGNFSHVQSIRIVQE